ncbi:MAG: mechanosensitive ion channel family protein [Acidobacteriaceae bacterium]|nr:mechanosensitive ion channel family protein [Acidobacteriaceae bacterium]
MAFSTALTCVRLLAQAPNPADQDRSREPSQTEQTTQASPNTLPPLQIDSAAVLRHLNEIISWYRRATTGISSVGLPTDAIYQDNIQRVGAEVVRLAFESARAEAALIIAQQKSTGSASPQAETTQQQNLVQLQARTTAQIEQLQSQLEKINGEISRATPSRRMALISQRDAIQSQLDLQKALLDAVQKMASFVQTNGEVGGGLEGSINELARSVPEVLGSTANPAKTTNAATPAKPALANTGGLISEAMTLYDYMAAVHQINQVIDQTNYISGLVDHLRTPLRDAVRSAIQQSQQIASQPPANNARQLQTEKQTFQQVTDRFKGLSGALLPLSQEMIVLNDSKANLDEWRGSITRESRYVLRSVLLRAVGIILALALVLLISEMWRRITFRYIGDPRRRRQFLVLRRVVIGALVVFVLVFGFVSEFSSLATFAGFITAGVAVALQALLLSVAAYFFIIGRYGIRVGDRISVAGITGDVVDIGLVRMYLMELAGTGVDFYPTGRLVVVSNSVLFQAGTPLFKQIPGTEYTWHEVVVTVAPNGNHKAAQEKLVSAVNDVYSQYRPEIERQHRGIERRMDIQISAPHPEARLQFADAGLELLVRYPVEIRRAPDIDEKVTRKVLELVETDSTVKTALSSNPKIRSAIRG